MTHHFGPLAIEARHVHFAYPDGTEALVDVCFQARAGELVAMMGANGSGKTTLLKVLMRLLHPQRGEARLESTDLRQLSATELYSRVGMVFQNPADQLFGNSVQEDVAFGPRNLGLPEHEVNARVEQALVAVGAAGLRTRPIHHLSHGQQKRVCVAGVLAMQPAVLLLDEPTAGLDPCGESQMIDLLLELNRRGTTLVVATHCVDLLPVMADRVYVLAGGRVVREGVPREVFGDPDHVAAAGLRSPLVTQLFHPFQGRGGLTLDRLPLSVAEAQRQIREWLDGGLLEAQERGGRP